MKFGQQLLSEFNLDWGVESYVNYKNLKDLLADIRAGTDKVNVFFESLEKDRAVLDLNVKQFEISLDDLWTHVRQQPQDKLTKEEIFKAYCYARAIHNYQQLNRMCFEKIIKKFQKRLGLRQHRKDDPLPPKPLRADEIRALVEQCERFLAELDDSYFLNPSRIDLARMMQEIEALYAIAYSEGDEILAAGVLEKVWSMDPRSQPRIVDYVDAHYYKEKLRKREKSYACKILCGKSNRVLARNVSRCLGHKSLPSATVDQHPNGECKLQVNENIRGDDVFIFQTCSFSREGGSLGHSQMELLLLIHTCRLASAARITAVIPYVAYQSSRLEMTAFAQMIKKMGCDRVLTVDLLAGQIQGYFENMPLDNVPVLMEFVKYFTMKLGNIVDPADLCIVSPRSTTVERAKQFADEMGCGLATVLRRRKEEEESDNLQWEFTEVTEIVGDVKGKTCIIYSSYLDDAENVTAVAEQLKTAGAADLYVAAIHGIFAGKAVERLINSPVLECVVTDSVCHDAIMERFPKLRVLPLAALLAECVDRIHSEASIGSMMHKKGLGKVHSPSNARRVSSMNPDPDVIDHVLQAKKDIQNLISHPAPSPQTLKTWTSEHT
ncbi:Ribose-phosphate pyrophosphokinase [Diplonema papillatum]|nr:Ribose-phosphate pyrophosphokinase [Diplonema papillatum]